MGVVVLSSSERSETEWTGKTLAGGNKCVYHLFLETFELFVRGYGP